MQQQNPEYIWSNIDQIEGRNSSTIVTGDFKTPV